VSLAGLFNGQAVDLLGESALTDEQMFSGQRQLRFEFAAA